MIVTKFYKINTNPGPGNLVTLVGRGQLVLARIQFLVTNIGTSWSWQLQGNDGTICFGPWTAALPSDGKPVLVDYARDQVCNGIPLVGLYSKTPSGTVGSLNLWASFYQPSTDQN